MEPREAPISQAVDNRQTTDEAIERWLSHTKRYRMPNTLKLYRRTILAFRRFMPDCIADLTQENIEDYLENLNGLAPKGYNAHLIAIKSFCRWREEQGAPSNPSRKIKQIRTLRVASRVLTREEYKKVLAICDPHNLTERDTIKFLVNTGLRPQEFIDLRPENISPDRKYLRIIGKGNRARCVPLNHTAQEAIRRGANWIFANYPNYNRLNRFCHRLDKRAGIEPFSPHALRHTFATFMMQENVPLIKISKILGHSDTKITQEIYIHWTNQDLIGVTDVLDG